MVGKEAANRTQANAVSHLGYDAGNPFHRCDSSTPHWSTNLPPAPAGGKPWELICCIYKASRSMCSLNFFWGPSRFTSAMRRPFAFHKSNYIVENNSLIIKSVVVPLGRLCCDLRCFTSSFAVAEAWGIVCLVITSTHEFIVCLVITGRDHMLSRLFRGCGVIRGPSCMPSSSSVEKKETKPTIQLHDNYMFFPSLSFWRTGGGLEEDRRIERGEGGGLEEDWRKLEGGGKLQEDLRRIGG